MAEFSGKSFVELAPNLPGAQTRLVAIKGNSAANNDTFTVNDLTAVVGVLMASTTGVAGVVTFATNVLTVTNAGALTWNGLVWGT